MPTLHPSGLVTPEPQPDSEMASRRIRQHRAWYPETEERRKEWEQRENGEALDDPMDVGWIVSIAFFWGCTVLIVAGLVSWALD